jgi:hypothetical protein
MRWKITHRPGETLSRLLRLLPRPILNEASRDIRCATGRERTMPQDIVGTVAFFKALPPMLFANVLTVTFVYCFAKISQKELRGEEEGHLTYLWLIYGLSVLALRLLHLGRLSA